MKREQILKNCPAVEINLAAKMHFLPQSSLDQEGCYERIRSVSAKESDGHLEFCQKNILCLRVTDVSVQLKEPWTFVVSIKSDGEITNGINS